MARLHRLSLPGSAQHLIQRDNNHKIRFFTEADYPVYLDKLKKTGMRPTKPSPNISPAEPNGQCNCLML